MSKNACFLYLKKFRIIVTCLSFKYNFQTLQIIKYLYYLNLDYLKILNTN